MGKFKDWANNKSAGGDLKRAFQQQKVVTAPARGLVDATGASFHNPPQSQPAGQLYYAPAPPPTVVHLAQGTVGGRGPVEALDPIGRTCYLVKVDSDHGDPYERLMSTKPDLAKSAGHQAPDVDAMRMTSVPYGAEMKDWGPNSRYYNGVSDQNSDGSFDGHRVRRDRELIG